MRNFITTLLFVHASILSVQAQIHYRLEGNIGRTDLTDSLRVTEERGQEKDGNIYSTIIGTLYIVNGEIVPFEGTWEEPLMVSAANADLSIQLTHIILDNGTTRINGIIDHSTPHQQGTPLADGMEKMHMDWEQLKTQIVALMAAQPEHPDTARLIGLIDSMAVSVLKAHPADMIGDTYMLDYATDIKTLNPVRYLELLTMMDSTYVAVNPKLRMAKQNIETKLRTGVGQRFKDFMVKYKGREQRLSDYVGHGQYVLVDFWASWCGPCREEMPRLVDVYNRYKDKGLQVLGIATWDDPKKSEEFISKERIPYPQILNVGLPLMENLYGLEGLPETILFAPDGTIVARGLRGEDIDRRLNIIFGD